MTMMLPIRPLTSGITPLERTGFDKLDVQAPGTSFGDVFKKALNDTTAMQTDAQSTIESYLRGDPVEIHQVMAASEEATISLQLLVEVRNKLTEAYRALINIQ
jgi:flagellar hook-basal body complex protein FliE